MRWTVPTLRECFVEFEEELAGLRGEFGVGEEGVEGLPRESGFVQGAFQGCMPLICVSKLDEEW